MAKSRLQSKYQTEFRPELKKELGLKNIMQVPRLEKIVLNVGCKQAVSDSRVLNDVARGLAAVTGQSPVKTKARKSIAGFKIREGMPLGVKVTLRGRTMYEFLDKLINLALPKVRDFQGVGSKMDKGGNYNLGIKEWNIFPELDQDFTEKLFGMNVTMHIAAENGEHSHALLKKFGMPFKRPRS